MQNGEEERVTAAQAFPAPRIIVLRDYISKFSISTRQPF